MIPLEVIIIGSVISLLNIILQIIRKIPKFKRFVGTLTQSKTKLESIQGSIRSSNNSLDDAIEYNDIEELIDHVNDMIDIIEEINFAIPK